jgi:hypothetical protein
MSAPFSTLGEALAWLAEGKAKYGVRAFTARPEYRENYPALRALWDADKPARDVRDAARKAAAATATRPANLLAACMRN